MADPLALLVAAGLGLLLGAWAGARLGLRLAAQRRAALGAHAQLARLWPAALPERSASDILAGIVRVALGGRSYELPVLPRGASRRWLETLDSRFAALAGDLEAAGNDTPAILTRLVAEADGLYELLLAYDRAGAGILPPREDIDEVATDTEILRGVIEVWRAVHPLADTLIEGSSGQTPGASPGLPTTPRRPIAGGPASSMPSPTSSSSPTSTPRRTASSATAAASSSGSSKPSASAQASSTTSEPTPAGEPAFTRGRRRSAPKAAGA